MLEDLQLVAEHGGGRTTCPECLGGPGKQLSANVYHSGGRWWVKCHRAACGKCHPLEGGHLIPFSEKYVPRPYMGPLEALPGHVEVWLRTRYPLLNRLNQVNLNKYFRWNPENLTLVMPFRKHNKLAGYIERAAKPGEDSPLEEYTRIGPDWTVKSKTWYERPELNGSLGWYRPNAPGPAVLVEDAISAICASTSVDVARPIISLFGTGLNAAKVTELYSGGVDDLRIALDKDATGQAFALARKWGLGFNTCRVIPLEKDIKDMTLDEFRDLRL